MLCSLLAMAQNSKALEKFIDEQIEKDMVDYIIVNSPDIMQMIAGKKLDAQINTVKIITTNSLAEHSLPEKDSIQLAKLTKQIAKKYTLVDAESKDDLVFVKNNELSDNELIIIDNRKSGVGIVRGYFSAEMIAKLIPKMFR